MRADEGSGEKAEETERRGEKDALEPKSKVEKKRVGMVVVV
jgi:hypothetical protein